jgi:hypothetical protein
LAELRQAPSPQIYSFDKITAAMWQLDTAVYLLKNRSEDLISIGVLVYSAWSIIGDLLREGGAETVRHYYAESGGCFEKFHEFWNFSKHAKKDKNNEMHFPEDYIENSLFSAIHDFSLLHEMSQLMGNFYYPRAEKLLK